MSTTIAESYTLRERAGLYRETTLYEPVLSHVSQNLDLFQAHPDDVVLDTYYKCGTTWLKSLGYSIMNYRDDSDPLVEAPIMNVAVPSLDYTTRWPGSLKV